MNGRLIRLQKYRSHFYDGKGHADYTTAKKDEVFVCVIVGVEKKKIDDPKQMLNVEGAILAMAKNIRKAKRSDREAAEAAKGVKCE